MCGNRLWGVRRFYLLFLLLLVAVIGCEPTRGDPFEQWHWRSPLPQGNALRRVKHINGIWVAVGEVGTLLTSSDGNNWSIRDTGTSGNLSDCTYGDGLYVAVGEFGLVLTSPDAIAWTQRYAGTFYSLNAIIFAAGEFITVGEATTILTSSDGIGWVGRSYGPWDLFDLVSAEGTFVAVGGRKAQWIWSSAILSSPDARVWTPRLIAPGAPFSTVAYGDGRFAAATMHDYHGLVWSSVDGVDWQVGGLPTDAETASLFYALDKWLCVAEDSWDGYGGQSSLFISTDLMNWSKAFEIQVPLTSIASGDGRLVASLQDGTFLTSSNGWNWAASPQAKQPLYFRKLAWANGEFIALGLGQISFSHDGATWTNLNTLISAGEPLSITYGHGRYVAGGDNRSLWTSLDGLNWTNPAPHVGGAPYGAVVAVAFANGVFVGASGYRGSVLTSPDGLAWTLKELSPDSSAGVGVSDIAFGNGRFVIVGGYASATSTDGTNWALHLIGRAAQSVAFGNGVFVAAGTEGILSSNDGADWTPRLATSLSDIAFGGGFFVAVGAGIPLEEDDTLRLEAQIWFSSDGTHWFPKHSRTSWELSNVTFGNGTFVIAGDRSTILQSDPLVSLTPITSSPVQLLLSGPVGRNYRIDYKDNLEIQTGWTALTNVTATEDPTPFTDTAGTNKLMRFYRAALLPQLP
jgi:hypothetical protein